MSEDTTRAFFAAPALKQDAGTTRLVYRRFGSGPALLLVHGFPLSGFTWRLGLSRYSVLAQDTGGTFARYLALEDGTRIDRLILINTEMPRHRPPWIPLYQFLMQLPGTLTVFGLLLQSKAYLRSPMGFGGCFDDIHELES